jgi:hypothetical protein
VDSTALLLLAQQSVTTFQSVGGTGQLVNSATMTSVFSWSVAAGGGGYSFRAKLGYTTTASAGLPQVQLQVSGGAATSAIAYIFDRRDSAATIGVAFRTATASVLAGPTLTSGVSSIFEFYGTVTFSAAGTFALQASCSVAADTWTIQPGSGMWLEPVP